MKKLLVLLALAMLTVCAFGQTDLTKQMSIEQKLGSQVPLDVPFKDEHGNDVKFGDVLHGRPVLLMPVFYTCLSVCSLEFESVIQSACKMKRTFAVGQDYDIVVVSINPTETPVVALEKEQELQKIYDKPESAGGWHFLTGSLENIHKVTDAIGFRYSYDPQYGLINHPSGIMMLTPEGKVSSYMLGANYPYIPLKIQLQTAGALAIGPKTETILLGCIMVDPRTGKRTLVVNQLLKITGIGTVLILAFSILKMSLDAKKAEAKRGSLAELAAKGTTDL